nr:4567_t:CDS:2 [Entrophospora candida]
MIPNVKNKFSSIQNFHICINYLLIELILNSLVYDINSKHVLKENIESPSRKLQVLILKEAQFTWFMIKNQLLLPLTLHPSGQMPYWNNNSTATILDVASSIKNKITLNETSSVNNDNYSDIYDGIDNIDSNNNNNNVNDLSRSDIYGEIDNTDNTNTNNNNYLFSNDTVNDNVNI